MIVTTYHLVFLYSPSLINADTAQYLSVAKNFISGNGFSTSIIYYNEQYLTGKIPAPQTVFPNGYPFLISLFMMFGFSPAYSAFIVCLSCFNLIGLELYLIVRKLLYKKSLSVFIILFWFFLVVNWSLVISNLSEMSFTFFTMTSAILLLNSESIKKKHCIFFSGLAAALSFTIRFTGIFFIFSIILYFFWKYVKNRNQDTIINLLLISSMPIITVGLTVIRNYSITGTFRGSSRYLPNEDIHSLMHKFYSAFCHITGFSKKAFFAFNIPSILIVLTIAVIFSFTVRHIIKYSKTEVDSPRAHTINFIYFIDIYIASSLFSLSYFDLAGIEPLGFRYLLPLIPFILIFSANTLQGLNRFYGYDNKFLNICLCLIILSFFSGQINVYKNVIKRRLQNNHYSEINAALDGTSEKINLRTFLRKKINNKNPLIANTSSELVENILEVPVIGLSEKSYINHNWDFFEVIKIIKKYNIQYIAFFKNIYDEKSEEDKNNFFFQQLHRKNIPLWLKQIYYDDNISLFKVNEDIK